MISISISYKFVYIYIYNYIIKGKQRKSLLNFILQGSIKTAKRKRTC